MAFRLPGRRATQATDPRHAPSPWVAGGAAFVMTGAFMAVTRLSYALQPPAVVLILAYFLLYGLAVLAVWYWSRRTSRSPKHTFALAAGALLTYAWYGVVQAPHDTLDRIRQVIFALLALGLVILEPAGANQKIPQPTR
jgi:hypothetical protein